MSDNIFICLDCKRNDCNTEIAQDCLDHNYKNIILEE